MGKKKEQDVTPKMSNEELTLLIDTCGDVKSKIKPLQDEEKKLVAVIKQHVTESFDGNKYVAVISKRTSASFNHERLLEHLKTLPKELQKKVIKVQKIESIDEVALEKLMYDGDIAPASLAPFQQINESSALLIKPKDGKK